MLRAIFVGPNGVRAGWRFLAYAAILIGFDLAVQAFVVPSAMAALRVPQGLTAYGMLVAEVFEGITRTRRDRYPCGLRTQANRRVRPAGPFSIPRRGSGKASRSASLAREPSASR